jgi:hypothetical protein
VTRTKQIQFGSKQAKIDKSEQDETKEERTKKKR